MPSRESSALQQVLRLPANFLSCMHHDLLIRPRFARS